MDARTLEKVRQKHRLYRIWVRAKHEGDQGQALEAKQDYIRSRNQATWECRKAQRKMEKEVAEKAKHNPKAFWSYVRTKTSKRTGIEEPNRHNGTKAVTDDEKAETLNAFFKNVYTEENLDDMPVPQNYDFREPLEDTTITEDKVKEQLSRLDTNKAPGPDGIHPYVLR